MGPCPASCGLGTAAPLEADGILDAARHGRRALYDQPAVRTRERRARTADRGAPPAIVCSTRHSTQSRPAGPASPTRRSNRSASSANASAPLRELAGVRFSQQRWHDAATLAERALDRDAEDGYAWDVLGSSRFIQNDVDGALRAWNHIDKPQVDSVQIAGLTRTRYAFIAQIAALTPNTVLTARQLTLANRRLGELPDRVTLAVGYRPEADGFATVNVNLVERSRGPRQHRWTGYRSARRPRSIERSASPFPAIPARASFGKRAGAGGAEGRGSRRVFRRRAPGRLGGIWRVDGSWEAQTYGAQQINDTPGDIRQHQTHGAISFSNWVMPNLRFEASSGVDALVRPRV